MARIVNANEEIQVKKKRKRISNFKIDVDILLLVFSIIVKVRNIASRIPQIQCQVRRSTTRLGHEYIQNALVEDPEHFRHLYRMYPDVFLKLCSIIRVKMGLKDTRYVSVEEMLATFLFIVGQNSRYIQAQDRFKRSRFSISTSFHTILKVLNALAPSYMAKPETTAPPKIRDCTRFYPYFKVHVVLLLCIFESRKKIYILLYFIRIVWELLMEHIFLR